MTLIQYIFHNKNILSYVKHALYRINNLKIIFVNYKFQNTVRDENDKDKIYFNIFKLHVMIHYVTFIRLYNSVQSFDTVYTKTTHKFLLKIFFVITNRINGQKNSILKHNIQRHNIIVMQNMIHYLKIKTRFKVKKQFNIRIIKIYQDLTKLTNLLNALNRIVLCQLK